MELKMIMMTHQESHTLHRHGINHREHVTIKIQDDCTDGGETQGIFYGYLRWQISMEFRKEQGSGQGKSKGKER